MTAPEKFRYVMREFKNKDLTHGTTGETVTDKNMALAIAYSEAQKIEPSYGRYECGGKVLASGGELMKKYKAEDYFPQGKFVEFMFTTKRGAEAMAKDYDVTPVMDEGMYYVDVDRDSFEEGGELGRPLNHLISFKVSGTDYDSLPSTIGGDMLDLVSVEGEKGEYTAIMRSWSNRYENELTDEEYFDDVDGVLGDSGYAVWLEELDVKHKLYADGGVVNVVVHEKEGEPYKFVAEDVSRSEANRIISEYKASGKPYLDIKIDDLPFSEGGSVDKEAYFKRMVEKIGREGAFERVLKDSQFNRYHGKTDLVHNRLNKAAIIKDNKVYIYDTEPKYKGSTTDDSLKYSNKISFDNPKDLNEYLEKNQIFADGGSTESWTDRVIVDKENAEAFKKALMGLGYDWDSFDEQERYSYIHFGLTKEQLDKAMGAGLIEKYAEEVEEYGKGGIVTTVKGSKLASLFDRSNELRKKYFDRGYSKLDLMNMAYGQGFTNVDSALPMGALEDRGISASERWRYAMDYNTNSFGEIVDLYEKISQRNPVVEVYNSDFVLEDTLPINEAYEKYYKNNRFPYMIDIKKSFKKGGSTYAGGGGLKDISYGGNIPLRKGDKIKVDHPHYKNLVLIIDQPYGDGYYYRASDDMSQRNWANGGWFDQMIQQPKNELVRKPISGTEELKSKERLKLKELKSKEIDDLSDEEYDELERLEEKYRFDSTTYAGGGEIEEQIARIIYKYQGTKSINYKYNSLYPILLEKVGNEGLDLDELEEYVDKTNSIPVYLIEDNEEYEGGGEIDGGEIENASDLYDKYGTEYPYASDLVAYYIFGNRDDDNKILQAYNSWSPAFRTDSGQERDYDVEKLSDLALDHEYNWQYNMEHLEEEVKKELRGLFADGGGVSIGEYDASIGNVANLDNYGTYWHNQIKANEETIGKIDRFLSTEMENTKDAYKEHQEARQLKAKLWAENEHLKDNFGGSDGYKTWINNYDESNELPFANGGELTSQEQEIKDLEYVTDWYRGVGNLSAHHEAVLEKYPHIKIGEGDKKDLHTYINALKRLRELKGLPEYENGGETEYSLEKYFNDYDANTQSNPYGKGGIYYVEIVDENNPSNNVKGYVWAEGEDELRNDINNYLDDSQFIEGLFFQGEDWEMKRGGETKKKNKRFGVFLGGNIIGEVAYAKDIYDLLENKMLKRWSNWEVIKYKDDEGQTVNITKYFLDDDNMSIQEVIDDYYAYATEEDLNEDIRILDPKNRQQFGHPKTVKGWELYEDGGELTQRTIGDITYKVFKDGEGYNVKASKVGSSAWKVGKPTSKEEAEKLLSMLVDKKQKGYTDSSYTYQSQGDIRKGDVFKVKGSADISNANRKATVVEYDANAKTFKNGEVKVTLEGRSGTYLYSPNDLMRYADGGSTYSNGGEISRKDLVKGKTYYVVTAKNEVENFKYIGGDTGNKILLLPSNTTSFLVKSDKVFSKMPSSFDDGGTLRIESGNKGKTKVVFEGAKDKNINHLRVSEIFEDEKAKGKTVFLLENDEVIDSYIQEGDVDLYAKGGSTNKNINNMKWKYVREGNEYLITNGEKTVRIGYLTKVSFKQITDLIDKLNSDNEVNFSASFYLTDKIDAEYFESAFIGYDTEEDEDRVNVFDIETPIVEFIGNKKIIISEYFIEEDEEYAKGGSTKKYTPAKKGNPLMDLVPDFMTKAEASEEWKKLNKGWKGTSMDDVIKEMKTLSEEDLEALGNEIVNRESVYPYIFSKEDLDRYKKEVGVTKVEGKDVFAHGGMLDTVKASACMVDGEISVENLEKICGHKPKYPKQEVGRMVFEKCFMKPYYRLVKK